MHVTGPGFVALQVADLERAATFYEQTLGLTRAPGPPHAVVFATAPIPFAVREPLPGFDPAASAAAGTRPGAGVVLWLEVDDAHRAHDELVAAGTTILSPPTPSPFGPMLTFQDPDGYALTLFSRP